MKNSSKFLLLAVILLAAFSLSSRGQTPVSGGIYANTTWTLANSPYVVTDTVVVFPGVTLTIQAGVTVKFADDKRLEIRQGTLIATGTPADSITFTSNSGSPTLGIWGNVFLNGCSITKLSYCSFKYAQEGIYAMKYSITNDSLIVKYSTFKNNISGIKNSTGGIYKTLIDNCYFATNYYGFNAEYNESQITITHSKFYYNQIGYRNYFGITINGSLFYCDISNNYITGVEAAESVYGCTISNDSIGTNWVSYLKNCTVKNNYYGIKGGCIDSCIITNNVIGADCYAILHSTIDTNSQYGVKVEEGAVVKCLFRKNGTGIIVTGGYTSQITKNIIENNTIGIELKSRFQVYCNRICNNTLYDLKNYLQSNYSISNNDWGTTNTALIQTHIYDGYDNISLGLINFMPIDTLQCYLNPVCNAFFTLYPDSIIQHQYYAINMASGIPPIYTYTWSWGDGTFSDGPYPSHTYSTAGYYNICLTITDSIGCTHTYCDSSYLSKNSNSMIYVNVIQSTGFPETSVKNSFGIFPNPASNYVTLQLTQDISIATIKVYNLLGELKNTTNTSHAKTDIDISKLAAGVYIIEVVTDKNSYRQKFIKE